MTFEKALDETIKKLEKEIPNFKGGFVTKEGLEAAVLAWNMIALALHEKGLDDFIIINNNNRISIPLKSVKQEKPEKNENDSENKKQEKGKSPQSETATKKKVDVKENEKQTNEGSANTEE